jgi:hypothetical protein
LHFNRLADTSFLIRRGGRHTQEIAIVKKPEKSKIRDLRDIVPPKPVNPIVRQGLDGTKPLVTVDEIRLVTPDVGHEPAGQTTHE